MRVPSPAMVVALAALFVALGGVGVAATGDNFILGQTNTASTQSTLNAPVAGGKALQVTNTDNTNAASSALGLFVAAGHPPLTVNTSTKVANLNSDRLDGIDSTGFLRNLVPLSLSGASASSVINGTNTGSGNGLRGVSGNSTASGVYGQNDSGGFGVAGRSNHAGGIGVFGEALGGGDAHAVSALSNGTGGSVIASNLGSGPPLELHSLGAPMSVDSATKVQNLNADLLDSLDTSQLVVGDPARAGGRLLANRVTGISNSSGVLDVPGLGSVYASCNTNTNTAQMWWVSPPNTAVDVMFSGVAWDGGSGWAPHAGAQIVANGGSVFLGPWRMALYTLNVARDTGSSTKIATVWLSWDANACRFQVQALESPQL